MKQQQPLSPHVTARARVSALLVAVLLVIAFAASGIGGGLERQLRNWRDYQRSHPASGSVVIVEIDAKSIAAVAQWPWPRRHYGELLDKLGPAAPEAVAFDVDFSSASSRADDALFAASLKRFPGTAILASFRQPVSGTGRHMVENLPLAAFSKSAFTGSVNVHPDADGVIRTYSFGERVGGSLRPSISALLAGSRGRLGEHFTIDQSIDLSSIPRMSFIDVVEGRAAPEQWRGKKILVGATAIELGDRYPTPLHGIQPGVVIQAAAVESLLQGGSLKNIGPWPLILLAVVIGIAVSKTASTRRRQLYLGLGAASIILVAFSSEAVRIASLAIVPALAFLMLFSILLAVLDALDRLSVAKLTDSENGLPNGLALQRHVKGEERACVIAASVSNLAQIESLLPAEHRHAFTHKLIDRFKLVHRDSPIFSCGNGTYAWTWHGTTEDVLESLAAVAQIMRQPLAVGGRSYLPVASFGLSSRDSSPRKRMSEAAQAAAKAVNGGEAWSIYTADFGRESDLAQTVLADLNAGMAEGQLWLAYQPKLNIGSGQIYGAEALIRWQHPKFGAIRPDQFIPVLEQAQQMQQLTLFVVDQALVDIRRAHAQELELVVAVNISATSLSDKLFVAQLEQRISLCPELTPYFSIELTESAALADEEAAIAVLNRFRDLGVSISIDDYGTGQSTLTYLKRFPAEELKIDQSFVRHLLHNRSDQLMVRSTIELAQSLQFKVVAEGVEDQQTLTLLKDMGCDRAQGWLIGKPAPFAALLEQLSHAQAHAA